MNNKQKIEQLTKARNFFASKKMAKGAYGKKANGHTECDILSSDCACVCMTGALHFAEGTTPEYNDGTDPLDWDAQLLTDSARLLYGFTGNGPDLFNDLPTTTKKMALNVFDLAIHSLKLGQ